MTPWPRASGRALTAAAVLLVLAIASVLCTVHPRFLFGVLVGDDAGYYLAVARNACLGLGPSFDRVDATNGFNPLVPALLIPLDRWLAPGLDLVTCFRIGVVVTWIAMAWSLISARRFTRLVLAPPVVAGVVTPLASGAVLWFLASFVAFKGYYGMDAFLTLALGLAYVAGVAAHGPLERGARPALRDGLLLALAVLARVDTLPLVVAAFIEMLPWARREPGGAGRAVARGAWFAAGLAPYVVWNQLRFHELLPISAQLKSSFPHVDPATSLNVVLHTSLNPVDIAAVFLALGAALAWLGGDVVRSMRPSPRLTAEAPRAALSILAMALAGRLAWLLLFSRLDVQGSYFILAHPFLAVLTIWLGARVAGARGAMTASVLIVLAGGALLGLKLRTALPEVRAIADSRGDEWAIGRRIHDAVGPDEVIYGGAFGLIGYVSDRAWINGDGVANTRAYQDAIGEGRLAEHLARRSVDFVAVIASPPRDPGREPLAVRAASVLHSAVDSIHVDPADIVIRELMRRNHGTSLWLARWRPPSP